VKETDQLLGEIVEKLKSGRVVLFIGAGCSIAAGAPSTRELVDKIRKEFPKTDQSLESFVDVCNQVIESRHYGRPILEEFIRKQFSHLKPSKAHIALPSYSWTAIYTTNFDDLIELAYRNRTDVPRRHVVVASPEFSPINFAETSRIYIFKIMGTIEGWKKDDRMALSKSDFNKRIREMPEYLKNLEDFVKDGTVVFVGYSGDDNLAFEIIDDVIESAGGPTNIAPSYILYPEVKSDPDWLYKFHRRKMIPVECTFEGFASYLEDRKSSIPLEKPTEEELHLRLRGCDIQLSKSRLVDYLKYFRIISEKDLQEPAGDKDDFFKGTNRSLGVFKEGWYFERDVYSGKNGLKSRVMRELEKNNPQDNCILLVTGIPGIGKSITLLKLAFDAYSEGHPVLIFDSTRSSLDFKLLDSLILQINNEVSKATEGGVKSIKPVVIFDDAASLLFDPNSVVEYLISRSRPALVVAAARDISWKAWTKEFPIEVPKENGFTIEQLLSNSEKEKIIQHLSKLGYIAGGTSWDYIIDREFGNSFFATIYRLVDPSNRPLNKIIRDQYIKLRDEEKRTYCAICSFHRFNLPINIELLVRNLDFSYEHFYKMIQSSRLKEIIAETQDLSGNLLYSTHNQLIAQKTVDFFFSDPTQQKEIYKEILTKVHFSNQIEHELIDKLMVFCLGPNSVRTDLTTRQKRELFSTVCRTGCSKSILHHWGILEMDDGNYARSEELLKQALSAPSRLEESYRGERRQNIITSLGMLYARWANKLEQERKLDDAERKYIEAENCFKEGRISLYPAPHPYHAEASMYLKRGDMCKDETKKITYYAKAISVIENAQDHLNPPDLERFKELELLLNARLKDEKAIEDSMATLADKYNSARGFYLYSVLLTNRSRQQSLGQSQLTLSRALEIVERGLRRFADDELCLMQRARILKRLHPREPKIYYEAFEQWFNVVETPTVWLVYELAVAAFELGYYEVSYRRFSDLEKLSSGNRGRFRFRYYALDDKHQRRIFEGSVESIHSPFEGEIHVEDLPELKRYIRFRPMACEGFSPQVGTRVSFNIGFNYVSPEATNLTKI